MRALISFVVAAVAVVVQLTIVDRIAFPGGAGPDLVLLVVAALALAGGPLAGALTGFWAGLALDVAPPGSHFTGQNALVFCLVGYACGLLAESSPAEGAEEGHTALFELLVTAAGAIAGEALAALLGVMLSDPRVTWPAIRHVLPVAIGYDLLFCPFVLYAVAAALRLAGSRGEDRRPGWPASQARAARPGQNQGAIRQLTGGNSPQLRLSERDSGQRPASGLRGPGVPRREPQLKFGRAGPRPAAAAFAAGGLAAGTSRLRFGGRRRAGVLGGSLLGGSGLGASPPRGPGLGGSRFGSSTMGRSLLGGSVFSRSSAPLGATTRFGRSSLFRRRGNTIRGAGGGLAGPAFRLPRGRSRRRLSGGLRQPAVPKSPGRGWLRGTSARGRRSLGGSALGGRALGGRALGGSALGGRALGGSTRGGRSLSRSLRGRGGALRGTSPRGSALSGRSARARLGMPRPKVKRRRRTRGGYR